VMSSLGTSGVIFAHSDEAFFDPEMRIQTYCHAVPGAWHLMGCVLSAGGALRWYRDTFREGIGYDAITAGAQNAPLGGEGLVFLPYLAGERTPHPNPNARGVFFGATLRSGQDYFARAVLEGVAFALADNVDLLRQVNVSVTQIRANGGGAKSPFWLQMMADVMNVTHITLNVDEGPAFGAALLASVGAGAYSSVPEACDATIHAVSETKSKESTHLEYQKWHTLYRALYPALQSHFDTVSQMTA
jgi:xylulokinase